MFLLKDKVATLIEKAAEKPTYPIYKSGGWIAKAGSCRIGLKPNPFSTVEIIFLKGLEVKIVNNIKPAVIKDWISKVFKIKVEFLVLYNLYIK
jgi:hypothetical protein